MNTRNLALCGLLLALVLLAMFGLNRLAQASVPHATGSCAAPQAALTTPFSQLDAVDMISAVDGSILQDSGDVYRYDGASWSKVAELEGAEEMHSLEMVSATEGWASGYSEDIGSGDGIFWRYDGSIWSETILPYTGRVEDIDIFSPTEGWAAGRDGVILRYNGTIWEISLEDDVLEFSGIGSVAATNDAWAVGSSGIYHFNSTEWQQFAPDDSLNAIEMLGPANGWAAGDNGVIQHYTGTTWISVTSPVTLTLNSLDLLPDGSAGWVVGGATTCVGEPPDLICTRESQTAHYDGEAWQEAPFPFADELRSVSIVSADDAWAVGYEYPYHYQNGVWTRVDVTELSAQANTGGPGSFFAFDGAGFDANSTVDVCVNRNQVGQVMASESGNVPFGLQTEGDSAPGAYNVVVGPSACLALSAASAGAITAQADQLIFIQEGAPVIPVPPGYTDEILDLSSDASPLAPSLSITKSAVITSVAAPGAPVTFTVRVDNSGDGNLTLTAMDDSHFGDVALGSNTQISSTTCLVPRGLLQGDFYDCQFVASVGGEPETTHTNLLTVTATTAITTEISGVDSAQVTIVGTADEPALFLPSVNKD